MKRTTEDFKRDVYNLVGDEYTVLGEYTKRSEKILMRHNCEACNNHEYEVTPGNFYKGRRCPHQECVSMRIKQSKTKTISQFKQEVYNLVGDEYTVLGEYINCDTKILMRHNCEECDNYEYEVTPNHFNQGTRCPKCSGLMKQTGDDFKQEVYNLVGNEYTVLGGYKGNTSKILMRHNCEECDNYEYEVTPKGFKRGNRCPKCAGNLRMNHDDFVAKVYELVGDEYTVLGKYTKSAEKLLMRHNCDRCHNHEYEVTANNFVSGYRCPKCALHNGSSKGQQEVVAYISSILGDILIEENNRSILDGKEIDILIPDLRIGFEYNGEFWHQEVEKPVYNWEKEIGYHKNKTRLASENGIKLYHIWERHWNNRQEDVKRLIQNILIRE